MQNRYYCSTQMIILCLLLLFPISTRPQPGIQHKVLEDGVECWYRVKVRDKRPWLIQEIENLFKIAFPPKASLPFGVSVAFLVGVSQYEYLRPQLPFVENDLSDLREYLLVNGGFDTVYVAANRIVNSELIEHYMMNKFRISLGERDRVLFYYSGHGADLDGITGYMQFSQAKTNDFARDILAIHRCIEWSKVMPLGHILFIYDCCASGLAFDPKSGESHSLTQILSTLSGNGSRTVITAGIGDEETYEVKDGSGKGNGVFTGAFLRAVESGIAGTQI